MYEQMALMSSAVAFSWSRWNSQCGQEHLVLQVLNVMHSYRQTTYPIDNLIISIGCILGRQVPLIFNALSKACEQLEAGPVAEKAWSLYLLGAQRSQRLKMKEHDDSFSPELAEGSEFHSTFLHMLRQDMSIEGQEKMLQSHYLYTDAVQRLLCATRVLTYS